MGLWNDLLDWHVDPIKYAIDKTLHPEWKNPFIGVEFGWKFGVQFPLERFLLPEIPKVLQQSQTYDTPLPYSPAAENKPRQLVLGATRAAALTLYRAVDLESVTVIAAHGLGYLYLVEDLEVDGTAVADLDGAEATRHLGSAAATAGDPATVNLRHLEPSGAELNSTVWDYGDDDEDPDPLPYANTTFEARHDGATVRVHLQAYRAWVDMAGSDRTFRVRYAVYHKRSGAAGWIEGGTYDIRIGPWQGGVVGVWAPIRGGSTTVDGPVTFEWDDAGSPVELDTSVGATYRAQASWTDAQAFAAGTYDLKVVFQGVYRDAEPDFSDGTLADGWLHLRAVEVEERNAPLVMRGTAYSAVHLPLQKTANPQAVTAFVAGGRLDVGAGTVLMKAWDPDAETWVREVTLNAACQAAYYWAHWAGGAAGEAGVDWDFLEAAAAYCDAIVAVAASGTTAATPASGYSADLQLTDGQVYVGYRLEDVATRESRCIVYQSGTTVTVSRPFSNAMASRLFRVLEPRFLFAQVLETQKDPEEWLQHILNHCRGRYWFTDAGLLRVAIDQPRTRAHFWDDDDLVPDSLDVVEGDPLERAVSYAVRWRDQSEAYAWRSATVGEPQERADRSVTYEGCPTRSQALRLVRYALDREALDRTISFTVNLQSSLTAEPGDRVGLRALEMGWGWDLSSPVPEAQILTGGGETLTAGGVALAFAGGPRQLSDTDASIYEGVIETIDDGPGYTRVITARPYDADLLADPEVGADTVFTPAWPSSFDVPAAPVGVTARNLGDNTPNGVYDPMIDVSWQHPHPERVAGWLLEISRDAGTTWTELIVLPAAARSHRWAELGFDGTLRIRVTAQGLNKQWGPASATTAVAIDNGLGTVSATDQATARNADEVSASGTTFASAVCCEIEWAAASVTAQLDLSFSATLWSNATPTDYTDMGLRIYAAHPTDSGQDYVLDDQVTMQATATPTPAACTAAPITPGDTLAWTYRLEVWGIRAGTVYARNSLLNLIERTR